MLKVIYDRLSRDLENKEASEDKFASIAFIIDKAYILPIIQSLISNLEPICSMFVQIKGDDRTLEDCFEKVESEGKRIYPMQSSGFLSFRSAELQVKISKISDLQRILLNWGHYDDCKLLILDKRKESDVYKYLKKDLYINKASTIKDYIDLFNMIIRQSGDENEVEILYHRKEFDNLQLKISEFIKYYYASII